MAEKKTISYTNKRGQVVHVFPCTLSRTNTPYDGGGKDTPTTACYARGSSLVKRSSSARKKGN